MNDLQSNMEDKIFEIVTDLLRDDIDKTQAIDSLLLLHNKLSNCTQCNSEINYKGICEICYTELK